MVARKTEYALVDIEDGNSSGRGKFAPDSPIFHSEPLDSPQASSKIFYFGDSLDKNNVTVILIAIQILMYIVSVWVVSPRSVIEPTGLSLMKIGSMIGSVAVTCTFHGHLLELRRLIVAVFLHAGIMHILMNVLFQISLGPRFEMELGAKKFATLFLTAGIVGNLVSGAFSFSSMSVGASTACYGLLGAEYMREYLIWPSLSEETKAMTKSRLMMQSVMLVAWEMMNWHTVCHMGHLGGFIAGFCIYPFLCSGEAANVSPRTTWTRKAALVTLACVVSACWLVMIVPAFLNWSKGSRECQAFARIYHN